MIVKCYKKESHEYKKMSYKCKGLKNIVIRDSIKVYSMHIIKQLFIFNFETM